jgi:hypothetical protein
MNVAVAGARSASVLLLFAAALRPHVAAAATVATDTVQLHGRVVSVSHDTLVLRLRDGRKTNIDITKARKRHHASALAPGFAVVVYGTRGPNGAFHAVSVDRTTSSWKSWPPDS